MNKSEKFWDRLANNFDKPSDKPDPEHIKSMENIGKHLKRDDVVLDYGCAKGRVSLDAADKVKEIHAIDISSKMISVAKARAEARKIENVKFDKAEIYDERYKEKTFDVIIAFNVFHLVEEPQKIMHRTNELLKPGGVIISETPCLGEKKAFVSIVLSLFTKIGIVPKISYFKTKELEAIITQAGFNIIETNGLNRDLFTSHLVIASKI